MLFDTNNDGVISFLEYIFFVTLLSIPESSFTVVFKMFDLNNNGQLIEIKEAIERQHKLFKKKNLAQKLLYDMLEETIEIVKELDPVLNDEDPKINQEEEEREPGIRLFKHVCQPGIVFDHFGNSLNQMTSFLVAYLSRV